ncbi:MULTISPECIES: hypothetical protein [unclassified Empedobacter]|uniref:hypothetical protein n=1 Tax=unclassified Empedobacter TaxID=2643773 RepID=UPI00390C9E54
MHQAENLKSGIKKIKTLTPEVILCNVKLPDGNGVEFAKEVKEQILIVMEA